MNATNRSELVEAVFQAVMEELAERFPVKVYLDPKAVAGRCGVTYTETPRGSGRGPEIVYEDTFGEDFESLVRSVRTWLAEEGYANLFDADYSSTASLSAEGAALMGCLPKLFRESEEPAT